MKNFPSRQRRFAGTDILNHLGCGAFRAGRKFGLSFSGQRPQLGRDVKAGWIVRYDLSMTAGRPTVEWTDHGRVCAQQLVAIDAELKPGEKAWTILLAVCHTLGPDKVQARRN